MKLKSTEKDLVNMSYLHQQYFSPRCWKTVQQALDEFENLTSKKDRIECMKEQILTRYLGLGWEEAHHLWLKKQTPIYCFGVVETFVQSCHTSPKCKGGTQSGTY
jgi:hypothetical protein